MINIGYMTHVGCPAASFILEQFGAVDIYVDEADLCLSYSMPTGTRKTIKLDSNEEMTTKELEKHLQHLSFSTVH